MDEEKNNNMKKREIKEKVRKCKYVKRKKMIREEQQSGGKEKCE